jgi:hypothetical protein
MSANDTNYIELPKDEVLKLPLTPYHIMEKSIF